MALHLFNDDFPFAPFFGNFRHGHPFLPCERSADASRGILIDVKEKPKAFEVAADLPGLSKEDIKLHVEGDVLSLAVEKNSQKQDEHAENGIKLHRIERSSAFMKRNLQMPESADLSKISARYLDGVLRLDIPKRETEVERSRVIPIE